MTATKVYQLTYDAQVEIKGAESTIHCEGAILATDVEDAIRRLRHQSKHAVRRIHGVRFIIEILNPDR